MTVLGLDTSCYTTSAALADSEGRLVSERRLLQVEAGERGLRQSDAVFQHVRQLPELVERLLSGAPGPVDAVCASVAPRAGEDSYMPVFLAGAGTGRAVAAALRVPFLGTNHQAGHLRAARVGTDLNADEPFLALHLSGGTTDVLICDKGRTSLAGTSLDLHAGQLVDRIGVALGLPFPAGPALEELAGSENARALVPSSVAGADCHLSGAEAKLLRLIGELTPAQAAAELYDVLCRSVMKMLENAARSTGIGQALLFGGVMSSARMRRLCDERRAKRRLSFTLHYGKPELSGDNAVGVALIGLERMESHGGDTGRTSIL